MDRLTLHTPRSAPTRATRAALREVHAQSGHVPNLHAALAQSEPALLSYLDMCAHLSKSSLTFMERQAVMMEVTRHNRSPYCMTGHSAIAHALGMPDSWLSALREGRPLSDARVQGLLNFTRRVLDQRGAVSDAHWQDFLALGYDAEHALDVMLAVAVKTLSNMVGRFSALPPDAGQTHWAWTPPAAPPGDPP